MCKLIVTAFVGILAISLSIFEIFYIVNCTSQIEKEIDIATQFYKKGNIVSAKVSTEKALNDWNKNKSILDIFLYHETVDEVGMGLMIAHEHLKIDSDEYITSCEIVKENLNFIKRAEYPIIDNIF